MSILSRKYGRSAKRNPSTGCLSFVKQLPLIALLALPACSAETTTLGRRIVSDASDSADSPALDVDAGHVDPDGGRRDTSLPVDAGGKDAAPIDAGCSDSGMDQKICPTEGCGVSLHSFYFVLQEGESYEIPYSGGSIIRVGAITATAGGTQEQCCSITGKKVRFFLEKGGTDTKIEINAEEGSCTYFDLCFIVQVKEIRMNCVWQGDQIQLTDKKLFFEVMVPR